MAPLTGNDDRIFSKARQEQRSANTDEEDSQVEWSSEGDPDDAYEAFKNRRTAKRKRTIAETKKAKAEIQRPQGTNVPMVGRRTVPKSKPTTGRATGGKGRRRAHGDDSSEADDRLMDEHLPDYVKSRKVKFDKDKQQLGEAGLRLPPTFDHLHFTEDTDGLPLEEKPAFKDLRPVAPDEDIVLEYSGGVIPAPIAKWLRPYQVKGAEFLHEKFVYQQGGILGDDMGLGKTIQVIAFLTAAFGKTGDQRDDKRMRKMRRAKKQSWYPRLLIVCPGSLMPNWQKELQKWGWWSVDVYHGSTQHKEAALQAATSGMLEVLITTYTTYRTNPSAINTVSWDCVIADECHILKGSKSETTATMNDINALCRIGLTGTAIQNNYDELWCLLNWANPGVLGSKASWRLSISEPLKTGQAHDASMAELAAARRTAQSLVTNLLPRFFLRRMKTLIADQLPKKSDKVVFCPLTSKQSEAYENFAEGPIASTIRRSQEPCPCNSGKKSGWCCFALVPGGDKWQNYVFPAIMTLQKLSNHVALLLSAAGDSAEKQSKDMENLQISLPDDWKDLWRTKESIMNFANEDFCGKWNVLRRLLQFWYQNGDKVLIFSHSVRLLQMLQALFMSTTTYTVSYLDGKLSYEDRQTEVDKFNTDPQAFVFLISTKAGGVGLNITSANKVVIVDPNWNPAHDLQAQDRAYRIGQTRDVEVFRLVSAGTIEEIVYARQIYKQQQANIGYNASSERRYFTGVQNNTDKRGEIFGLLNLFAYQGDHVVLREIVNKTNIAESRAGVNIADLDMTQTQKDEDADDNDMDRDMLSVSADTDSQDAAMGHLAKVIASGGDQLFSTKKRHGSAPKKTDVIQGILASVGVEYTHENSEVIGTSRVESKLSRRALEDRKGSDPKFGAPIFAESGRISSEQSNALRRGASPSHSATLNDNKQADEDDNTRTITYRYKPPEAIRSRQFCTMSKLFGFEDVVDFALVVEGWTQEERRTCLDRFYALRRRALSGEGGQADGDGVVKVEVRTEVEDTQSSVLLPEAVKREESETNSDDDEL